MGMIQLLASFVGCFGLIRINIKTVPMHLQVQRIPLEVPECVELIHEMEAGRRHSLR